jgi:transcriptional regulator with XRE-family HTH domain
MLNNPEIIERLTKFGVGLCGDNRGWKTSFAEKLKMKPQQLQNILSGKAAVGEKIQSNLRDLGADVDYILTGRKKEEPASERVRIQFDMPGHLTEEQGEQYKKLIEEIGKVSSEDPDAIEKMLIITQTIFKKK